MENGKSPQLFRLKTQLLSEGRSNCVLARTDLMTVTIKCYAQGGENALHTHPAEDHTFIVLDGKARFYGPAGEIGVLKRNEGIMLPRGAYYRFESCGDIPLVLLRVGADKEPVKIPRIDPEGKPLPGDSLENKHIAPVPIEGRYYE